MKRIITTLAIAVLALVAATAALANTLTTTATVSGTADALVHMLASDVKQLERALERIRDEPNVDHTRSVIVLSRLIDRPRA